MTIVQQRDDTAKLYKLVSSGVMVPLKRGQIFQDSNTNLRMSLVGKGYIKRYTILNDGTLNVQSVYGPGHFFPLTIAYRLLLDQEIYHGPETIHYEAMTNAVIYSIDNESFVQAAKAEPAEFYKELFFISGRRTMSNIQRLENVHLDVSPKKVAHQLLFFGYEFGSKRGETVTIDLPLTHQDVADVIGTTRETVSMAVAQLKSENLIQSGTGKRIIIPNITKLKDFAYS